LPYNCAGLPHEAHFHLPRLSASASPCTAAPGVGPASRRHQTPTPPVLVRSTLHMYEPRGKKGLSATAGVIKRLTDVTGRGRGTHDRHSGPRTVSHGKPRKGPWVCEHRTIRLYSSDGQTGFHARRLGQQRCDVHWRRRQSPGAKIAETANAKLHASAKRSSGKRLTQICHKSAYQQFHRRWTEQRAQLVTSCSGGDLYRAAPLRYPRRYRYDIRGENKWGGTFGQRLWTLGEPWC